MRPSQIYFENRKTRENVFLWGLQPIENSENIVNLIWHFLIFGLFLFDNLSTDIEQLFLRGQNENSYNEFNMTRLLGRCSKLRKLDIEYIHTSPWTNRVFQNLPHLNPHKNKKLPYEWPYIPVKMLRHWIWDMKSDQVNLFENQGYWRYLQGRLLLDM